MTSTSGRIRSAPPSPEIIRAARAAAGHTQTEAAVLIDSTLRRWQDWEGGAARMHPGLLRLYLILTDRHPVHRLVRRR